MVVVVVFESSCNMTWIKKVNNYIDDVSDTGILYSPEGYVKSWWHYFYKQKLTDAVPFHSELGSQNTISLKLKFLYTLLS